MIHIPRHDRERILTLIKTGTPREISRAHCLNMRSKGFTVIEVAESLELTPRTVINVCGTYSEYGLERALHDDPRPGRPIELDARVQSFVVAAACSDPPEGFDRWTLDLLKEKAERDGVVDSIARESIRLILREHDLKPWQQKMWCVPKLDDEYIERMEQVLDVYEFPYNANVPVVCIDEKPTVLHSDARPAVPMSDGQPKRVDYEYVRKGTANVFCGVEPKAGVYFNKVTESRCGVDFALFLADISLHYREAKKIILVMDNLSTHTEKSVIECFGEEDGHRLWSRFHVVHTPKHASWLNQAEIAIGMYQRQCLGHTRIPDIAALRKKTAFWNKTVNAKKVTINWQFNKADAREKFDYQRSEAS